MWTKLKETIDAFKQTLPLTVDLRNPAMRKRHWDTLIEHVGQFFDPTSRDFTLAKVCPESPYVSLHNIIQRTIGWLKLSPLTRISGADHTGQF